jgi:serine/threonine protein kinase
MPTEGEWFIARKKQKLGPVSLARLKAMAATGQLQATDMVWKQGSSQWQPAATLIALFSQVKEKANRSLAPPASLATALPGPSKPPSSGQTMDAAAVPPHALPAPVTVSLVAVTGAGDLSSEAEDRLPAPSVAGYEVAEELGRGGMGIVYRARQISLDRVVALKMVLTGTHAGPRERARFQAEAQAVARLLHANIVQIYEVGESEGRPYFSLEFVDGGSLGQKLNGTPQPA